MSRDSVTTEPTLYTRAHVKDTNVTCNGDAHTRVHNFEKYKCSRMCARALHVTPGEMEWDDLPAILQIPELRQHQASSIQASIGGRDVLHVAATGGGKTAGFLGSGLLRGGLTLVVSPLRSLIADQQRRLQELGLPVRIWNSDVKDRDKDETLDLIASGWQGFLYSTPESLSGKELSSALRGKISLAVVDEAHCVIREKGFRSKYSRLGSTLDRLGVQLRYACTATLPARDEQELIQSLRLKKPVRVFQPIDRENLSIKIVGRDPYTLGHVLNAHKGESGIVFAATVRTAASLHSKLRSQGHPVALYHGRLRPKEKKAAQKAFMSGELPVAIVTDAFLLGIDKANIRFIVHYDHPETVENWVQGFGRAGRDGLPATVYGCFTGSDEGKQSRLFLIKSTYPSVSDLNKLWSYLISKPFHVESQEKIGEHALGRRGRFKGSAGMKRLKDHRLVSGEDNPEDRRKKIYRGRGRFDAVNWSDYERERKEAFNRFERFCELAKLPDDEIPAAINRYFGADDYGIHGEYPASWDETTVTERYDG